MDITNIPKIVGFNLPNSVTYGLSLSTNYSSSPSKLTLNLVSQNGQYTLPTLKQSTQVVFGNFTFKGIVWGYNLKESSQEKTLEVEIIDNSLILDQHYVVLWKRGLLNYNGDNNDLQKTFDFSGESILIPSKGNSFTSFKEVNLGKQTVKRKGKKLNGASYGNVIILGTEKFADSSCDLSDTYYTFNDLKNVLPKNLNTKNLPDNNLLKGTHEGTLREVLNNWCSDLGFDFYWDYNIDSLVFYSVNAGITLQLPSSSNVPQIISKETSSSMDGTFRQYGLSYTAMPKQPLKTISFSDTYSLLYSVPAISISYLLRRNGILKDLNEERGSWGSGRNQSEFLTAAFLGFISKTLRDLYCIKNSHYSVLGYAVKNTITPDKTKMINFLLSNGFQPLISALRKIDSEELTNHQIALVSYDEGLGDRWHEVEQDLLRSHGAYYRIPDSSGSFFYCNDKYTIEISITVDPEGQSQTFGDGKTLKKILNRSGQMSHDNVSALEELDYESISEDLAKCTPTHIALKEGDLANKLVAAGIIKKNVVNKISHILIVADYKKIIEPLINLDASLSRGLNPVEFTWYDQKDSNTQEGRQNCVAFDERLSNSSCISAEEEARKAAIKKVGGKTEDEKNPDNFVSGLTSKSAQSCNIKLKTKNVKIYAPSDSSYQVVCSYSINASKISDLNTSELFSSETNIPKSFLNDVGEIRISNENVTDPFEDSYSTARASKKFPLAPPVIANQPQKTVKYVFAGEPVDVNLNPSSGLTNLDISLSSEGFTTSATFSSRPPKQSKADNLLRLVNSQLNRSSFNAN